MSSISSSNHVTIHQLDSEDDLRLFSNPFMDLPVKSSHASRQTHLPQSLGEIDVTDRGIVQSSPSICDLVVVSPELQASEERIFVSSDPTIFQLDDEMVPSGLCSRDESVRGDELMQAFGVSIEDAEIHVETSDLHNPENPNDWIT